MTILSKKFLLCILTFVSSLSVNAESSIYSLPMKWKSDKGELVTLSKWKGKKTLMTMLYTSCKYSCPLMMKKLKKIESTLSEKKIKYEFIIISLDPENDTPASLAKFKKDSAVEDYWNFLTGSESDTRMLSMVINIRYSKNPKSKVIGHDNKIVVLDEAGSIIKTLDGMDADISNIFNE